MVSGTIKFFTLSVIKNVGAEEKQLRFCLRLHYSFHIKLYQILTFYTLLMPKKHLMCSISFVVAGLNGCCFFHASILFEMSCGDNGRKIIFSLPQKGTEASITREYAKPL